MPQTLFKWLGGIFAALLILLSIALAGDFNINGQADIPTAELLEVIFLDVGQGDSILIKTPNQQTILIDGGPDNSVLNQLAQQLPFFDNQIDVMILTHPHSDHVTGLVEILRRYEVMKIYATGVLHTAPDYLAWLEEIDQQAIPFTALKQPLKLDLGAGVVLEFLYPLHSLAEQSFEELNNTSVVNRLVYGEVQFLLTGDAEVEQERELLTSGQDLRATVMKIGHHGSSSSTSEEFLAAVNPEYAVIQTGVNNSFGHPHLTTIRRLERAGVKIYRTDQHGTVRFFTDGQQLSNNQ